MKTTLLISAFALLLACGSETKTGTADVTNTAAVAGLSEAEPSSPGAGKCLLTYQTRLDEALPLAAIKKHYTGDMSKAKIGNHKSEKRPQQNIYDYRWDTGKVTAMKVGSQMMNVSEEFIIGLAHIREISSKISDPVAYFYRMYHTPTPEEIASAKKIADEQVAKKLKEKGITASENEVEAAKNSIIGLMGKTSYQKISSLGDAAAWDESGNILYVLTGHTKFSIITETGPDKSANLELAKKLAGEVLAKCK